MDKWNLRLILLIADPAHVVAACQARNFFVTGAPPNSVISDARCGLTAGLCRSSLSKGNSFGANLLGLPPTFSGSAQSEESSRAPRAQDTRQEWLLPRR